MKNQISNKTPEGTRSGDVAGGFTVNRGKPSGVFYFITPRDRRVRLKRASLAPARGSTQGESEGLYHGMYNETS